MIKLATVSPCYNEEEVLEKSAERLTRLFKEMIAAEKISPDSKIVFPFVCGINLAHNVGHQYAIMAGMMTMKDHADAVITIDADLQDDLKAIPQMVDDFAEGNDIVYGVKVSRQADPVLKRMSAVAFYRLQEKMGVKCIFNHADFRLMSRRALNMLAEYPERNLYLRGLIPMIGLKHTTVDDTISERQAGHSKYTLKKMLNLALDGITSFSVKPIYLVLWTGAIFMLVCLGIFFYVLHALVEGTAVAGWSSVILSIWLVGAFVLFGVGIIGVYVGKIYQEVKHRPLYHISDILGKL